MPKLTAFQDFLDILIDASALLDENGEVVAVNREWRKFAEENGGDSDTSYIGRNYLLICDDAEGEASAMASTIGSGIRKVLEGRESEYRAEYPCHSPSERRWFEIVAISTSLDGRHITLVSHRDISARKIQADQLRRANLAAVELAALVATSPDGIVSFDLDGKITSWNDGAESLYGYSAEEITGQSIEQLYPDDWPVRFDYYRDKIISGELTTFDVVRKTKSGEHKHVAVSASPVRDEAGEIIFISNIHRDITDRINTQEYLKTISRELEHRVKNIVSVIHAIVEVTGKDAKDFDEFYDKFRNRLQSLLSANELLISSDWKAVLLRDLAKSQLRLFADTEEDRVTLSGPPVLLAPHAVEVFASCLHELATNAVKHGALGKPKGTVELDWKVKERAADKRLVVLWQERGVTGVRSPGRKGYGHSVLTRNVRHFLDAEVRLAFGGDGVLWSVALPEQHFRE